MKKIISIMRKEYLETRLLTLCFWIVGLLFSFVPLTHGFKPLGGSLSYAELNYLSYYVIGGLVAVWSNSFVLCAVAFARERENGTLTILRRIASDWRIAVIGKLGYVFLSSLALAVFFFLTTLGVDLHYRLPLLTTCGSFARSDVGLNLTIFCVGFGFLSTFCWGFFWTNAVSRQSVAIFLAFLTSVLVGYLVSWAFAFVYKRMPNFDFIQDYFCNEFVWHSFVSLIVMFLALLLCKSYYRVDLASQS